MTELATFKSIIELTEELFYRMVGDYFSTGERLIELAARNTALKEGEKRLPKLDAFETYSEYLEAVRIHETYHELTDPALERVADEVRAVNERRSVLEERLKDLLPDGVWFRYGDKAIRSFTWTQDRYRERFATNYTYEHQGYKIAPNEWTVLEQLPWEKVRPIPKTITRTKKKSKYKSSKDSYKEESETPYALSEVVACALVVIFTSGVGWICLAVVNA